MQSKKIKKSLDRFLWGRGKRNVLAEPARVALVCFWKFHRDKGPLRAAALAFSTALGLVPLLALAFAVVKGLGAEGKLISSVVAHLSAGNVQVAERVTEYVGRIKVSTLGLAGFGAFMLSALFVLANIEHSFNDIWGVARGRTLLRRITDYSAILIVCPILILLSTSMATTAQVSRYLGAIEMVEKALPLLFSLGPFLAKGVAFAAAYLVIPNHRVGWSAAAAGGLVAAVFWHFAESWYIGFGIGMVKNNAVYGALAHLPAFLLWVYVGWCIVIFGAELACVLELPGRGRYLKGGQELWTPRPSVALGILVKVAVRYARGVPAVDEEIIAEGGFHPVEGRRIIGELVGAGLLVYAEGGNSGLLPARNPDGMKMAEVVELVLAHPPGNDPVERSFLMDIRAAMGTVTWGEWARITGSET